MSQTQELYGHSWGGGRGRLPGEQPPLREFRLRHSLARQEGGVTPGKNVGQGERVASFAVGSVLALLGLGRRDLLGLTLLGVGAATVYRGASGRCALYQTLGIDTSGRGEREKSESKVRVSVSYLIQKSPEELYLFWRNFENLPRFMSHLESVQQIDERRSHWVAKAPKLFGGKVEWDAEMTADEPNSRIAWRSLPNSDIEHHGSIKFEPALGDRGTKVRVELRYEPPAGQLGRWTAKIFGEEPEQQIHDDLRNFKRIMEVGEIPTIVGQPRGTCMVRRRSEH